MNPKLLELLKKLFGAGEELTPEQSDLLRRSVEASPTPAQRRSEALGQELMGLGRATGKQAAYMTPGLGEALDAHDLGRALREGDKSGAFFASLGLALPFVAGGTLKRLGEGAAKQADEFVELEHYSPRANDIDVLDPGQAGTGQAGRELQRQAAFPEEYVPRFYAYTKGRTPEDRFRGMPKVTTRIPRARVAGPQDQQRFIDQAREQLEAEGHFPAPARVQSRAERLLRDSGDFDAMEQNGVVVSFQPLAVTERGEQMVRDLPIARATLDPEIGGATIDPQTGEDLFGQPLISVAARGGDDMVKPVTSELDVARAISEFREEFADDLAQEGHQLGTWLRRNPDGSPKEVVLDVARTFPNDEGGRTQALYLGRKNDQDALFDLGTGQEIEVPYSAQELAKKRLKAGMRTKAARAETIAEIEAGLTPDELEHFRSMNSLNQRRVMEAYLQAPTPRQFASAAFRGAGGRGWYEASAEGLVDAFGDDAPRFAALLAATSPQKSVEENLKVALRTWRNWVDAGRPADVPRSMIASDLDADIGNAITALTADSERLLQPEVPGLLSGPKVDPFYANLIGETQRVVNDTHMARGFGTSPSNIGSATRSLAVSAVTRNAARQMGELSGGTVNPPEAQEMAWSFIRGLTNASGGEANAAEQALKRALDNPEELLAGGRTLDDRINDNVAIGDLLGRPEFREMLEGSGARIPERRVPEGLMIFPNPDAVTELAQEGDLRNIAQRIDAIFQNKPLFSGAGLLGGGLAAGAASQGLFGDPQSR